MQPYVILIPFSKVERSPERQIQTDWQSVGPIMHSPPTTSLGGDSVCLNSRYLLPAFFFAIYMVLDLYLFMLLSNFKFFN